MKLMTLMGKVGFETSQPDKLLKQFQDVVQVRNAKGSQLLHNQTECMSCCTPSDNLKIRPGLGVESSLKVKSCKLQTCIRLYMSFSYNLL